MATVLLVTFFALLSVRMFGERERVVRELRPFLSTMPEPQDNELLRTAFDSLCSQVLNVAVAYLLPVVPFASALAYPAREVPHLDAARLAAELAQSGDKFKPVDPAEMAGAVWAIPLESERGMVGVLLLGPRADGGLYTQEEIEIAQATGERVLEAQARAELTRRLIALSRGRLAATQVVDRRARRVLHDDILPQLHSAILNLKLGDSTGAQAQLSDVHHALSDLLREMPAGVSPQVEQYGVLGALKRAVAEEFPNAFDGVTWEIASEAESRASALTPLPAEVLYAATREAIRNAARHGRGGEKSRLLHLRVCARGGDGLTLEIQDDGVGVVPAAANGGQGLQLHRTMMTVLGGEMLVERVEDQTRVTLKLPFPTPSIE
jgi:signal transduction histidine kinase